jgi:EAL domain-containing protein (putative c-di-GMP-specific phosphodiesterase class I)
VRRLTRAVLTEGLSREKARRRKAISLSLRRRGDKFEYWVIRESGPTEDLLAIPPKNSPSPTGAEGERGNADQRPSRDSFFAMQRLVTPADLSVVFQPIVDLATGKCFAYEALVRCRKPELANPLVLFERAVSAGCVGRLGRMIRDLAVPLAAGRPIFLNVHPQELQERWLVRPDDPIYLHDDGVFLEITESVPLTHYDLCIDVLREVRARSGVHLVVDDLGAGYSNLKRIADLAPQVVKLDRGLVCGLDRSPRQQQLVSSVVRLCTDLHAAVVAEGIETEDELRALADTGAHYGQGYLFARPAFPIPPVTWPPSAPRSFNPHELSLNELRRRASAS